MFLFVRIASTSTYKQSDRSNMDKRRRLSREDRKCVKCEGQREQVEDTERSEEPVARV